MVKDPVCGMQVDESKTKHSTEYGGEKYYFCSAGCKTKFGIDPDQYIFLPSLTHHDSEFRNEKGNGAEPE